MASTADWHKAHLGQQLQALLPVLLLGTLALFTYWLVRNSPIMAEEEKSRVANVKPNAYFHQFRLISFDLRGEWEMQATGTRATHRADLERYDIESPRISIRCALCTMRSRIPSATVGSPICSCHLLTGICEVRIIDLA